MPLIKYTVSQRRRNRRKKVEIARLNRLTREATQGRETNAVTETTDTINTTQTNPSIEEPETNIIITQSRSLYSINPTIDTIPNNQTRPIYSVTQSRDTNPLTATQTRDLTAITHIGGITAINQIGQTNPLGRETLPITQTRQRTALTPIITTPIPSIQEATTPLPISNDSKVKSNTVKHKTMSSKENQQSREDVMAAREAKKSAKQKSRNKDSKGESAVTLLKPEAKKDNAMKETTKETAAPKPDKTAYPKQIISKDEVDKAAVKIEAIADDADRDKVKAERAAKKAAKQAKKKGGPDGEAPAVKTAEKKPNEDMTVKDVVETLRDIKNVAEEVKEVTAKVKALELDGKKDGAEKKTEEDGKSKAELKAERRAKQEAQRAAKQAAQEKAPPKPKELAEVAHKPEATIKKEKSPKPKMEKMKSKAQIHSEFDWFGDCKEFDKELLNKIPINSNLHPAIVKLGVQLATRVVSGSNARCVALLDALKKMVRDYSLPARTEFSRGLEAALAPALDFLWALRRPTASQTNAVKYFRHHLNQLPNNVDEFDAKKTLQEEIDRYIREQIDMAGEAISIAVRKKISDGDNILTYGCSSLIERILVEAHAAGVRFRVAVCGGAAAARTARRLAARGLRVVRVDLAAIDYVIKSVSKVLVGAVALLANGWVVGAAGGTALCAAARAHNRPVLVACETQRFSEHVHTDPLVYNEIGDPDEFFNTQDENSPLKDWRTKPNLNLLNLTYDITPPSLITAVVTELAILPCTSAPVVLRFKLSEYGI